MINLATTFAAIALAGLNPMDNPLNVLSATSESGGRTVRWGLELGGKYVGALHNAAGGELTAVVVSDNRAAHREKQIGSTMIDPFVISAGMGMDSSFYNWIENYQTSFRPGALLVADANGKLLRRIEFTVGKITQVTLPTVDAGSTESAEIGLTIAPETVRDVPITSGQKLPSGEFKSKKWQANSFRVSIGKMDCSHVKRVNSLIFTSKQDTEIGAGRGDRVFTVSFPIPDLVLNHSTDNPLTDWSQWHRKFLVEGNNGNADKKTGTVEYLAPDMKTALVTVTTTGLGIYRMSTDYAKEPYETTTTLYVEDAKIRFNAQAIAQQADSNTDNAVQPPSKDARFGTTYAVAAEMPWSINVEKAQYQADAFVVGKATESPVLLSPTSTEKFIKVALTFTNTSSDPKQVGYGTLKALATGSDGNNSQPSLDWKRTDNGESVNAVVPGGNSIRLETVITVPASGAVRNLQIGENIFNLTATYNPLGPLPKYLSPTDGVSVLPECNVKRNDICHLGRFQAVLTGFAKSKDKFEDEGALADGEEFLVYTLRMKNSALDKSDLGYGGIVLELTDSEKQVYKALQPFAESANSKLPPVFRGLGKDTNERIVRYLFRVPANCKPNQLTIREGTSRIYVFTGPDAGG